MHKTQKVAQVGMDEAAGNSQVAIAQTMVAGAISADTFAQHHDRPERLVSYETIHAALQILSRGELHREPKVFARKFKALTAMMRRSMT